MRSYRYPLKYFPNFVSLVLVICLLVSTGWLVSNIYRSRQCTRELQSISDRFDAIKDKRIIAETYKRYIIHDLECSSEKNFDWVQLIETKLSHTSVASEIRKLEPLMTHQTDNILVKEVQLRISPVQVQQLQELFHVFEFEDPSIRITNVIIEQIDSMHPFLDVILELQMIVVLI